MNDNKVDERGSHKHRCDDCGTIWQHGNDCNKRGEELRQRTHTCPECGRKQFEWYEGSRKANVVAYDCELNQPTSREWAGRIKRALLAVWNSLPTMPASAWVIPHWRD